MAQRIPDREITPRDMYMNRRTFMRAGLIAAAAVGTGALYRTLNRVELALRMTGPAELIVRGDRMLMPPPGKAGGG